MEIALAHTNMDFDSLAAQYGLTKLHPALKMVPGYPLQGNIRNFLSLYRDSLPLSDLNYLDLTRIKHIFLVDCQHLERLDELARGLIKGPDAHCTYTIYDHHQLDPAGLGPGARADSIIAPVGSSTTLVVDEIRQKEIKLTAFEATLLAIGIYEDTGCLTYSGTCDLDAACVSFLLKQGADLSQVNNFINPKLTAEQNELFERLTQHSRTISISGIKVIIAHASCPRYIEGLATMTRRLLELTSSDAAIAVVHMRDRVHIVGRSDTQAINVRHLALEFGGDGHPGAASAVSRHRSVGEVLQRVEDLLKANIEPERVAADIMTSPVRTIRTDTSMDEASRIMLRYGQDGLVVVEGTAVVGIVSRRDIDKAAHHKLSHAPVRGFMSRPVISIREETPLSQIQHLMVKEDIGRLPVLDKQLHLKGIVSRKDVLKTLYGALPEEKESEQKRFIEKRCLHLKERLESLDEPTRWLFKEIGRVAAAKNMVAYAVGGCVRDLFLDRANFDLDFVVEGSALDLADALESAYPSRFQVAAKHDRFQTATLIFQGAIKREVDLSTARTEFYEFPAALPTVEASVLEQDLFRRDFTINALAICLSPANFGEVEDFFNGISDLEAGAIRILHPFSFIEDPTRIVRAARFASRLGFNIEPETKQQAERAIGMGIFDNLGGFRLKEELKLILMSPERLQALDLLNSLGGDLRYLATELVYDHRTRIVLRRAERLLRRYKLRREWIVYLGLLLSRLKAPDLSATMDRLFVSNEDKESIAAGIELPQQFGTLREMPSRKHIYAQLQGHSEPTLAIAACLAAPGSSLRRSIKLYLEELRNVRVSVSGNDLLKMGFPQGPQIKEALCRLQEERLDGNISCQEDEIAFIRNTYPDYCQAISP